MNKNKINNALNYLIRRLNNTNIVESLSHPIEVSNILIDLNLDDDTIIAGLLHPLIELNNQTVYEIERIFGSQIINLVLNNKRQSREEKALSFADTLSFLRRLYIESENSDIFTNFDKIELCRSLSEILELSNDFKDTKYYNEYKDLMLNIFNSNIKIYY